MSRLSLAPVLLFGAATGLVLAGCGGGGGSNNAAPAVTQKVTGFVWDADTAAPIIGATVKVQGTTISATTQSDGSYTVGPLNPTRSYNLLISNAGYVTDAVKMLSKNATLQGPTVILTKANDPTTIQNTGGTVTSNATLDGNTGSIIVPANALPGGASSAPVSATLITGTAVPGVYNTDTTKVAYPVMNVGLGGGTTGNFTQPVTVGLPLPFPMTAGATVAVVMLGADGTWGPLQPAVNATVDPTGHNATFSTTMPGTYAFLLPITASATVQNVTTTTLPGPYTDPVTYPLTGTTVNWSAQANDARDALDATFTENQRNLNINVPGDLDAVQLVIHPRGTSLIEIIKQDLNVTFTSSGFQIQQAVQGSGNGTVTGLAYYQIVPHQQGSGSGS